MSQTTTIQPIPVAEITDSHPEISLIDILGEIQATPKEYWPNLFKIVTIFRESVTLTLEKQNQLPPPNEQILITQHEALKELTKEWVEQGDEQEQTETYEYLSQVLEKVSI